jgi:hypothetical protein
MWFESFISSALNRRWAPQPRSSRGGIALGQAVEAPHPAVTLSEDLRRQHVVILGKSGSGKTHALQVIAMQLAARDEALAFLDFHGDASTALIARLSALPNAHERLVILDPSHPTRSPGLNILQSADDDADRSRRVSDLASILRKRWGVDSFGARTEELLRNSLYALAAARLTLADLPRLLTDTEFRARIVSATDHPEVQAYWLERFEVLSEAMKATVREPLLNKVTGFLTEPAARHLLGQRQSTIDFESVIARRQWLIVRLPKGRLREHAHTLGNLIFAQLQAALLARDVVPIGRRHTCSLLCDEAQNLAENDLEILFAEGRKFGASIISASQFLGQASPGFRAALLSAGTHLCFQLSSPDAGLLASELSLERKGRLAADLTHLGRGEAIGSLGGHTLVRFRVPPLAGVRPITSAQMDALIEPVTRDRREIEALLRQPRHQTASPAVTRQNAAEGQHDW